MSTDHVKSTHRKERIKDHRPKAAPKPLIQSLDYDHK